MKVKKSKEIAAYIPTASMADIAFLLIIFFMVSSVFPVDKTKIETPTIPMGFRYEEDSAIISITSVNLETMREDRSRSYAWLATKDRENPDVIFLNGSEGIQPSTEIYRHPQRTWDMRDPEQYTRLRNTIQEFMKKVYRRRERETDRNIIIVLKADAKIPFIAVDGVMEVLQEVIGASGEAIAILGNPEEVVERNSALGAM